LRDPALLRGAPGQHQGLRTAPARVAARHELATAAAARAACCCHRRRRAGS
jgi:hypothetical protein